MVMGIIIATDGTIMTMMMMINTVDETMMMIIIATDRTMLMTIMVMMIDTADDIRQQLIIH